MFIPPGPDHSYRLPRADEQLGREERAQQVDARAAWYDEEALRLRRSAEVIRPESRALYRREKADGYARAADRARQRAEEIRRGDPL